MGDLDKPLSQRNDEVRISNFSFQSTSTRMESRDIENSGILDKPITSVNPDTVKSSGYISKYIVLCLIAVADIMTAGLSLYVLNEYYVYAIREEKFPNTTEKTSITSACHANKSSNDYKIHQEIQSDSSELSVYNSIATGIPYLITCSSFPAISDQYGRKFFLILPVIGAFIKYVLITIGVFFKINVYVFIVFNAIEACTGGWIVILATAFSYIADIIPSGKTRSLAIAALDLLVGIAIAVGSFISGYFVKYLGFLYTFFSTTVLLFVVSICAIFYLQESRDFRDQKQRSFNILSHYRNIFRFYTKESKSTDGKPWKYLIILIAFNLLMMFSLGKGNVEILYFMSDPFCMDPIEIGVFSTVRTVIMQSVGIIAIKILQFCVPDELVAVFGAISAIAYCIIMGIASDKLYLYMATLAGGLNYIPIPMIRAIMSKMAAAGNQGAMFAGVAVFEALGNMFGGIAAGAIYSKTLSFYHGFVFFVLAGYTTLGALLLIVMTILSRKTKNTYKKFTS